MLDSKKLTNQEKQGWLSKFGNMSQSELEDLLVILATEEIEKQEHK